MSTIEYPYYMSARILSRSRGHNAVAAAAYRSGQKLVEGVVDKSGLVDHFHLEDEHAEVQDVPKSLNHDYRRRGGVMDAFIMLPKSAPSWMNKRSSLWNAVEESEKRKDAQVAREVIVSLPDIDSFDHLSLENKEKRRRELYEKMLRSYVKENFTDKGMVADVALHEPCKKNDKRHYHAHILLSTRVVTADGFGKKERDWNKPEELEEWRKNWAKTVNDMLQANKISGFVDHRSYKERGLDIAPTKAMGTNNSRLEHFGIETSVGNDNRKAREENREGHKYLEKLFEFAPHAHGADIEDVLKKEGFADPQSMKARLEEEGILIPLYSRETGLRSGMYSYAPLQKQADLLRGKAKDLYKRNGFELPEDLVQKAIDARGDKLVREALHYAARPQGFKVIEAEDNGHKTTFMGSVKDMYKKAGYEVVPVARNNQGKNAFKASGFTKGILTYRDFLRRFGVRYTGAKSTSKKVIIVDEADQLSPLQDQEIFNTARKINAKLIYIGSAKARKKRHWKSLFAAYKILSAYKKLRHKFIGSAQGRHELIRTAFLEARTHTALKLQGAKYLHKHGNAALSKRALLDKWQAKIKKRDDKRFILTSKDKDAEVFNFAIQKERLRRKHLVEHTGRMFSVSYKSDDGKTLKRDMNLYWGDMIQFKKTYFEQNIEEGTRARILIHHNTHSKLELDDGRVIDLDLKAHNGFDLGYAGRIASNTTRALEESYIHHTGQPLDDAPLLYAKTAKPVHIFYDETQVDNLQDLSLQLLGRRHDLAQGFHAVSPVQGDNDDMDIEDDLQDDQTQDHDNRLG